MHRNKTAKHNSSDLPQLLKAAVSGAVARRELSESELEAASGGALKLLSPEILGMIRNPNASFLSPEILTLPQLDVTRRF